MQTYIYETPEILINAQINTYSGTTEFTLIGAAPQWAFDADMKNNVVIVINKNDDEKTQLFSFNSSSSVIDPVTSQYCPGDYNTEDAALSKAKEIIDAQIAQEGCEKWQITSNSNKILDNYGNIIAKNLLGEELENEIKKILE